MDELISLLSQRSDTLLLLVIAGFALLESLAFVGILVPGIALLTSLSWLAGQQALSLPLLLLAGFIGAAIGDLISYLLGRYSAGYISRTSLVQRHPQWLDKGEQFFKRYGGSSIFIGRFVGPIRAIIPFVAGSCQMPISTFMVFNLLSALCWALVALWPAYWLGTQALALEESWNLWLQLGALLLFIALLLHAFHQQLSRDSWLYKRLGLQPDPQGLTRTYAFSAATCATFTLVLGLRLAFGLTPLELGYFGQLSNAASAVKQLGVLFTHLGDSPYLLLATLITTGLCLLRQQARAGWTLLLVMLCVTLLNVGLKVSIDWTRPELGQQLYSTASFPSGHASGSACLIACWAILLSYGQTARFRRLVYLSALLPVTLAALSRVILGVHWPLDVLAGMLEGIALATILRWQLALRPEGKQPLSKRFRMELGLLIVALTLLYIGVRWQSNLAFYLGSNA